MDIFYDSQIQEILSLFLILFKDWWWLILPLIFYFPLKSLYFWWFNWDIWYPKIKWILLEIKPPKEILKPFKAMEDIFNVVWSIAYASPIWKEKWCEGQLFPTSGWFSCEIVSFGGKIHFYLRIQEDWQKRFESVIYSQYPEFEINLVDDYAKHFPSNIPNKDYDVYDEEYCFISDNPLPIKTYSAFFELEREKAEKGEEKIDPLHSFLEDLSKLKSGEQFCFQINAEPILEKDYSWQAQGKKIINEITKRSSSKKPMPILLEAINILISGPSKPSSKEEIFPPEMILTPGEKEFLKSIENKISKPGFKTSIRILYFTKRDAWYNPHCFIARAYLSHFFSGSQGIITLIRTRPKIHYFLRDRRVYLRKRRILKNYLNRFHPQYPHYSGKGVFILNSEELATIFHFPSKVIVPGLFYVEAKKGVPPAELPI